MGDVTKNAFDILMSSARNPGAFDMPLSSLDKQHHGLSEDQLYCLEEFHDSVVKDAIGRINLAVEEHEEEDIDGAYFDGQLPTFLESRPSSVEALSSPPDESVNPPTFLTRLTVHFRWVVDPDASSDEEDDDESESQGNENLRISGIVLTYSNGWEKEVGLVEGSAKRVTVSLDKGEHITSVYQHVDKMGVVSIRFDAYDPLEREFFITKGKMVDQFDEYAYEHDYRNEKSLKMASGSILQSLEWSQEQRKIVGAICQEMPKKAASMVSLAEMARSAIPDAKNEFQGLKEQVRTKHIYNVMYDIAVAACDSLMAFYLKDRAEALLQEFHLYEASRWNHYGNSMASWCHRQSLNMNHLNMLKSILLVTSNAESRALVRKCDRIVACTRQRVLEAKNKLKAKAMIDWNELYRKHESQLATVVSHGVHRPGTRLCPYCFGTFSPSQVRILRQCSKEKYFDCIPSCGCRISSCDRCHVPYCHSHLAEHEKECVALASSKCGWSAKREALDPEFCRQAPSTGELSHCSVCNTLCCEECRVECVGRSRKPNWKEIWLEEDPWSEAARHKRAKRKRTSCSYVWCVRCSKVASHTVRTWQCCDECEFDDESSSGDDSSDSDYTPKS